MTELLEAGFTVTLVGMSVVFVLLTLLGLLNGAAILLRQRFEQRP
jgi:Na+-transporting methylmalonyl-CoA/oxaloacetate decarboxylase gamma subunit